MNSKIIQQMNLEIKKINTDSNLIGKEYFRIFTSKLKQEKQSGFSGGTAPGKPV